MTPERWEQVGRLYEAASELAPQSRAIFLRDACMDDPALRDEVESLLANEAAAGAFLQSGAMADAARILGDGSSHPIVGRSLGHYEILCLLGSGGMGEVYRARDSRLSRDVAVKVLPDLATESESARARFNREAQAVAVLAHPNIRSLYDVGEADGRVYAVMELLEGETLRGRLARGPLPVRKAVEMAAAIAEGIAAAHGKGIVHRDLKPENVFITNGGHVKVLDFGLAKMQGPLDPQDPDRYAESQTAPGVLLGTVGYMSPEQVAGSEADARSDIFSVGCVLYEMVCGRRPFERKTAAETMAAIVNDEPAEQEAISGGLRRMIAHCLEKQPEERFQSAMDLAFHLRSLSNADRSDAARVGSHVGGRSRGLWVVACTVALAVLTISAWALTRPEPAAAIHSYLLPPEQADFCGIDCGVAVSPDGQRLAFVARAASNTRSLWVRPLSRPTAQRLEGTEGASSPFWSPDGRYLAFFVDDTLKKLDVSGGSPEKLCRPCTGSGAWSANGIIVFGSIGNGLRGVSSSGGDPFPVTELDSARGDTGHLFPAFLPDGRRLLFRNISNSDAQSRGIYAASLDSRATTLVRTISGFYAPISVAAGHLLFGQEGRLMAAPFDDGRLLLTGEPTPIAESVGPFSVSPTGILVFGEHALYQLAWLDRSGREIEALPIRGNFHALQLSHDGRRAALTSGAEQGTGANDIWVYDLARGIGTRLTTDPARDALPLWSPNDDWIVFGSDRSGRWEVYRKRSTGVGREEIVFASELGARATSWSRDGQSLILSDSSDANDLWRLSLPERKATLLFKTPAKEWAGQISPNGRWIAYNSNETGQAEIYVQTFPPSGDRRRISRTGGLSPRWRGDGSELLFMDTTTKKMMSVAIRLEPTFEASVPQPLFDGSMIRESVNFPDVRSRSFRFDVTAEGQRFLVVKGASDASTRAITLVQNWTANLKK